jgi:hypothetical protein
MRFFGRLQRIYDGLAGLMPGLWVAMSPTGGRRPATRGVFAIEDSGAPPPRPDRLGHQLRRRGPALHAAAPRRTRCLPHAHRRQWRHRRYQRSARSRASRDGICYRPEGTLGQALARTPRFSARSLHRPIAPGVLPQEATLLLRHGSKSRRPARLAASFERFGKVRGSSARSRTVFGCLPRDRHDVLAELPDEYAFPGAVAPARLLGGVGIFLGRSVASSHGSALGPMLLAAPDGGLLATVSLVQPKETSVT